MSTRSGRPGHRATGVTALWNRAVAHHQAGRLGEAETLYREVLIAMPQHFDATHLLGVVALQRAQLDEAQRLISDAIVLNPKSASAHSNLGNVYLRQQRLDAARASFQRAVEIQPGFFDARLNLGMVLRSLGRPEEAATHLRRAVSIDGRSLQSQAHLGAVLLDLGDSVGAVRAFEAAARLRPDSAVEHANLGTALAAAGDLLRALEVVECALKLDPKSVPALTCRGTVLARLGHYAQAHACLEQVVVMEPNCAAAHCNVGMVLRDSGQPEQAIGPLHRALAIDPTLVAAHVALAQALREAGRESEAQDHEGRSLGAYPVSAEALAYEGSLRLERDDWAGAERVYRQAIALQPQHAESHYRLGNLLMLQGRSSQAVESYRKALAVDAGHLQARWAMTMAQVPPVSADVNETVKARSNLTRMLGELDRWFDARHSLEGHKAVGSTQPFYLAYQAQGNRDLLARYGALCVRLMTPWQTQNVTARPPRVGALPLRVGIASAHLHDHSVWNAILKGWVRHLDRQRFEVSLFNLGGRSDAQTEQARVWARRIEGGRRTLAQWARTISESELDILIYPEIGMDALTTKLASLRLAPVQAASWGHPETTGLPTIDHYLSAEDLEPPEAEANYTERLVKLPHLGVCYEPATVTAVAPDLAALGLPPDVPLLLCPGKPFKYAPQHDALWVEISRRLPVSCLVFFRPGDNELGDRLAARLQRVYQAAGLDFERQVRFVPFLDRAHFYGLMKRAHLFLDTPGFSGFNTAMQAVECSLPIVTREGEFMRGRFGSGILRRMNMDEWIARSDAAYVDQAVALVLDEGLRAHMRDEIVARRGVLFGDMEPVRALERFIGQAVRTASAPAVDQETGRQKTK